MPQPSPLPRIAYFPDSFHEVNGVAHTSRNFAAYARRHGLPFLCVRAGQTTRLLAAEGSLEALELGRSPLSIGMEKDLSFDPLFFRYSRLISDTVRSFRPDIIHVTGPSELGIFGAYFAWKLGIPLVASWHTNVHEYAARRMRWLSRHLRSSGPRLERRTEAAALDVISRFYSRAMVLFAPNPELCALLESKTERPCHLMQRGVDAGLFTPANRKRAYCASRPICQPVLGYVGRLSVEKNVALLPQIDAQLRARNVNPRWVIVGHGAEEAHLRSTLGDDAMAGVLRGQALADAYADMDLFVFPSHTDTFGNVVLEALASGVPAIVTPEGGPAHILNTAEALTGPVGRIVQDADFADALAALLQRPEALAAMRSAARAYALTCSWDAVFDRVVAAYPSAR